MGTRGGDMSQGLRSESDEDSDLFAPCDVTVVRRRLEPWQPIGRRIRGLFQAKSLGEAGAEEIIQSLQKHPIKDQSLFRHEACYTLGQLGPESQNWRPIFDALTAILADERECEVTRHEAAEGLGN